MSNERESQEVKEFKGDIGGVNNRLADSAVNGQYFQSIEGIMPWEGEHRRIFGKKTTGKMFGVENERSSVITIHALPGGHVVYQTKEGLYMDNPFDADTVNWAERAGVTTFATLQKVDRFVRKLKADNLWGKITALYPYVGGTAQAHAQNLIGPQYQMTWVNGPTHNANGVTGNGTTQYGVMTGINTALTHHSHRACYSRTSQGAGFRDLMGFTNGANYYILQIADNFIMYHYSGSLAASFTLITDGLGFFSISRNSDTDFIGYKNGVAIGSSATFSAQTGLWYDEYVLARSELGTPFEMCAGTICLSSIGAPMNGTDMTNFYAAVQALQTSLGRQI